MSRALEKKSINTIFKYRHQSTHMVVFVSLSYSANNFHQDTQRHESINRITIPGPEIII